MHQSCWGVHEAGVCILHIFLSFCLFYCNWSVAWLKFLQCKVFRFYRSFSSGIYKSFPLNRIFRILRHRRHVGVFFLFILLQWRFVSGEFKRPLAHLFASTFSKQIQSEPSPPHFCPSRVDLAAVFSFGLLSELNQKLAGFEVDFPYSTNQKVARLFSIVLNHSVYMKLTPLQEGVGPKSDHFSLIASAFAFGIFCLVSGSHFVGWVFPLFGFWFGVEVIRFD